MFLTRKWNSNPATQTNTDAQANASMKMMDIMFPGMTLFMAFSFSGMLGLYWTFQALLGLLQSFILAKAMPLPKYTEEELKQMEDISKRTIEGIKAWATIGADRAMNVVNTRPKP